MNYTVTEESLANLSSYETGTGDNLDWSSIFILPAWLQAWWQVFHSGNEIYLRGVRQGEKITGIAPLMVKEKTALFIGDTDVCDYLDFIVVPGREKEFFAAILGDLKRNGITHLDLKHIRGDSTVFNYLMPLAQSLECEVAATQEEISLEMDLPSTWDEYMAILSTKQRHEVRRKLRRLAESGEINYHFLDESPAVPDAMNGFFKMFTESRQDKTSFLTEQRESFFRLMADNMTRVGLLRLGILGLDEKPVAEILCFDYNNCVYLYNSGYDPEYNFLSAGLLSKVLAIKDSIERGKERFDFLKGAETYKYHLGGREVPLYRCQIGIK